jgi:hypothetical protein
METRDLTTKMTAKIPKIVPNCESSVSFSRVGGTGPEFTLEREAQGKRSGIARQKCRGKQTSRERNEWVRRITADENSG